MKKQILASLAAIVATTGIGGGTVVQAAFDENLNMYTLDAVVVEADRTKNKFGDTITEQSYYRTGGDVKVITREEIENRHYTDLTDAIKRVPGVTFANAGYRGGEYGYNSYNNSMSINGDSRVIVLIDGRRVDNSVSTRFGSSDADGTRTLVDLNQLVPMEDVDKVEIIKGPGASVYGTDATGGVINIITRKGGVKDTGTIDLATGSWGKHVYNLSYSGAAGNDKSWKYFIAATRQMSGDSKYYDNFTNQTQTYDNTGYKDDGVSIRVDKDFANDKNLTIWYNHKNGKDSYPITAKDYRYWNETDWHRIIYNTTEAGGYKFGNDVNPGYRNVFSLDGYSGSYNSYRNNDLDITYTFNKDNGMESFVRAYNQDHRYYTVDIYPLWEGQPNTPDGLVPFPGSAQWEQFLKDPNTLWNLGNIHKEQEKNHGITFQYGKSIGNHDLLGAVTFDKSSFKQWSYDADSKKWSQSSSTDRKSILGFIQDKIHITDKWDLTPAIRYMHYSGSSNARIAKKDKFGNTIKVTNPVTGKKETVYVDVSGDESLTVVTPTLNTEYAFSDTFSAYAGWTKIYRPVKAQDYATETLGGGQLEDEKGDVYTIGLRKELGNTEVGVHYDWTDMSNAITYYPIYDKGAQEPSSMAVNAKEKKQSFNITIDQKLGDHWTIGLAYTHMNDKYTAKNGEKFGELGLSVDNVNSLINDLRPANYYTVNVSYESGKWYSGLLLNYYTGMNTTAFSTRRALVLDWNLNYDITKNLTTYVSVTNLTNEGYENAYSSYNGIGAAPQPGRAFMVGARYKF